MTGHDDLGPGAQEGARPQPPKNGAGPPAAAELIERISWLIKLRWMAILGVFVTIEVVYRGLRIALALPQLHAVLLGLAGYNLLLALIVPRLRWERQDGELGHWRVPTRLPVVVALAPVYLLKIALSARELLRHGLARAVHRSAPRRGVWRNTGLAEFLVPKAFWGMKREWEVYQAAVFAISQISVDLIALALLLHFAGGVENPCIFFLIFHVIISSILLSARATFLMTTWAVILAAFIGVGEYAGVLAHYPLRVLTHSGEFQNPVFVFAQLTVLSTTLYLAAYMASSIVVHMRSYEREAVSLADELEAKAATLESTIDQLTKVEEAKSQYMRKVAHELKGPLGTIQVLLKVVLDGLVGEVPDQARDMIRRAERRAGELAQATADLLTLTRAREGQISREMVALDLGELAADVMADQKPAADQAGVTVTLHRPAALGRIVGESAAIKQLVGNLLSNAIRYSLPGGQITVTIGEIDHESVLIEVEDHGIGIPEADQARIFEEFFRAGNAKKHASTGTGLGLAIVRAVTEQHGGTLELHSKEGEGTRFSVRLPRQQTQS